MLLNVKLLLNFLYSFTKPVTAFKQKVNILQSKSFETHSGDVGTLLNIVNGELVVGSDEPTVNSPFQNNLRHHVVVVGSLATPHPAFNLETMTACC